MSDSIISSECSNASALDSAGLTDLCCSLDAKVDWWIRFLFNGIIQAWTTMLVLIRPLFCYSSFMLMTIIIMIIITYINTFHYTHVHNIQSFLHIKCIVYRALVIKYSNLMEIWNQFYQTFKCIYVWSTSMIIDVILYKKSWIIWIVMSVTKEESSKLVALVVMCV